MPRRIDVYCNRLIVFLIFCFTLFGCQSIFSQSARVKKGDMLEIRVYGYEELSKTVMVEPDGTIDYPLVANIPVEGFSLDELREILKAQASKYMREVPIISIRFSLTMNVGVTILGQVIVPGEYLVPKRATVQGVITRAGGTTPRAQLDNIKLIRKNGGKDGTLVVDLHKFYTEGDPSILPDLEDGDVVVVPGVPGSEDVKVVGEVKDPGSFTIYMGTNLLDAIYMAGGPTEDAALGRIRLVTPFRQDSREREFNVEKLLKANKINDIPYVKPGDIIFVPKKSKFWRNLLNFLRDAATIAWPIVMILYYTGTFDKN